MGFGEEGYERILPPGATAYDYIQSDGTQWIDTEVGQGKAISSIVLKGACAFTSGSTQWSWLYFINLVNGSGYVGLQYEGSSSARLFYGTGQPVSRLAPLNKNIFVLESPNVSYGATTRTLSNPTWTAYLSILLFANPLTGGGYRISKGRIWATTIQIGGRMVRDYQPCTDPNGKAALYDYVTKRYFYGNNSTGNDFTVGNDQ